MKEIFINGYLGFKNFGDDLLFISLINLLEKIIKGYKIYYISNQKYDLKIENNFLVYFPRRNIYKLLFNLSIKKATLINLGGLFQDLTGFKSFLYYFFINLVFILKKGKIVNISIDVCDLNSYIAKILFKIIIKKSVLTIFRERGSFQRYKNYKNVYLAPDIAFNFEFRDIKRVKKTGIVVVLKYTKRIHQILKILSHIKKKIFLLMPEDMAKLKKYLENENVIVYNGDIGMVYNLIKNSNLIVSMRYHPIILCLKYKKKFIIISDENKIIKLAENLGLKIFIPSEEKNIDNVKILDYINRKMRIKRDRIDYIKILKDIWI